MNTSYFYDYRIMDRKEDNTLAIIRYKVMKFTDTKKKVYKLAVPIDANYDVNLEEFSPIIGIGTETENLLNSCWLSGAFKRGGTLQRSGVMMALNIQEGYETMWRDMIETTKEAECEEEAWPTEWGQYR